MTKLSQAFSRELGPANRFVFQCDELSTQYKGIITFVCDYKKHILMLPYFKWLNPSQQMCILIIEGSPPFLRSFY